MLISPIVLDVIGPAAVPEIVGANIPLPALLISAIVLFLGIPLIEAVVYMVFKWGNFKRSFRDAFLVNLVTTVIGYLLVAIQPSLQSGNVLSQPSSFLVVAFVLSVVIEGALLVRLKRQTVGRTWLLALVSNLASYAGLFLLTIA